MKVNRMTQPIQLRILRSGICSVAKVNSVIETKRFMKRLCVLVVMAAIMSGCNTREWHTYKPLNVKQPTSEPAQEDHIDRIENETQAAKASHAPKDIPIVQAIHHQGIKSQSAAKDLALPKKDLMLNADGLPLPRFIDMALGELLEMNYEIAPELANRQDAVTLHVSKPVPAQRLFEMVQSTLDLYKVSLIFNEAGGVRVVPSMSLRSAIPVLDTQKEITANKLRLGRIIEFMPLNYISGEEAANFARLFSNTENGDEIRYVPSVNALMMIGSADSLPRMREAIATIDRPSLQSKSIRIIRPVFWSAKSLLPIVNNMLAAQSIPVVRGVGQPGAGVAMFTIDELNALVVVSPQKTWQTAVQAIINELDVAEAAGRGSQVYIYNLRNTRAQEIGRVIGQALGQGVGQSSNSVADAQQATVTAPVDGLKGLSVIVDEKSNALIFIGDANVYQGILPLLKSLDRLPRQVMLEVTIAEVSLNDTSALGIIWGATNVELGSTSMIIGTGASRSTGSDEDNSSAGGLALPSGGLGIVANNRNITAQLAALAGENRARILSTPRILVMDGESASLVIGDQISVIKSEITNSESNNNLVRGFDFVETGVILDISPTINEGGMVQMELTQEVSTAGEAAAGGNPNINKRKIQTKMVARNGQTIAIGGMISHSLTTQKSKVPILGDLPILGALFSSRSGSDRTTELILLVTPYVLSDADDAKKISDAMREQLDWYEDLMPSVDSSPVNNENEQEN
jgi:general secretion pathway protein D